MLRILEMYSSFLCTAGLCSNQLNSENFDEPVTISCKTYKIHRIDMIKRV